MRGEMTARREVWACELNHAAGNWVFASGSRERSSLKMPILQSPAFEAAGVDEVAQGAAEAHVRALGLMGRAEEKGLRKSSLGTRRAPRKAGVLEISVSRITECYRMGHLKGLKKESFMFSSTAVLGSAGAVLRGCEMEAGL